VSTDISKLQSNIGIDAARITRFDKCLIYIGVMQTETNSEHGRMAKCET